MYHIGLKVLTFCHKCLKSSNETSRTYWHLLSAGPSHLSPGLTPLRPPRPGACVTLVACLWVHRHAVLCVPKSSISGKITDPLSPWFRAHLRLISVAARAGSFSCFAGFHCTEYAVIYRGTLPALFDCHKTFRSKYFLLSFRAYIQTQVHPIPLGRASENYEGNEVGENEPADSPLLCLWALSAKKICGGLSSGPGAGKTGRPVFLGVGGCAAGGPGVSCLGHGNLTFFFSK